jgi:hypothetical protein
LGDSVVGVASPSDTYSTNVVVARSVGSGLVSEVAAGSRLEARAQSIIDLGEHWYGQNKSETWHTRKCTVIREEKAGEPTDFGMESQRLC